MLQPSKHDVADKQAEREPVCGLPALDEQTDAAHGHSDREEPAARQQDIILCRRPHKGQS